MNKGILYVVPTPIGNLEDITFRAVRILKECDAVVCEDTRQTLKLLSHLQISKPLISFYTQNQLRKIPQIISMLEQGKNISLVSDCGTPAVSDPGYYLVKEAVNKGIEIVSLPGPCALITGLVASGLPTDSFVFLGFLRKKTGKMKKELEEAKSVNKTIIFYESPHRIIKTLETCAVVFGGECSITLGRELTKKFEEYIRGTISGVLDILKNREILGEFVIIIYAVNDTAEDTDC